METSGVLVLICCLIFVDCDKNFFAVKRGEFEDRMAKLPDINSVIQELKEIKKHQSEMETNVIRNQLNLFNKTVENQNGIEEIESNLQMKQNEIDTNFNTMISNQNQLFHKLDEKENETRTNQNKMQLRINEIETNVKTMTGNQNQLFHKLEENQIEVRSIQNKLELKQNEIEANQIDLSNKVNDLITGQGNLMNKVNTILRLNVSGKIEAVVLESNEMVQTQLVEVQSATQNVKNSITALSGQIQTVKQNVSPKLYCNNRLGLADCIESHFTEQKQLQYYLKNAQGSVVLMNGRTKYEGRIEVNYQGRRGTVCDDYWDDDNAQVICRMLGFSGGAAFLGGCRTANCHSFGAGTGEILLDDVHCSGSEQSIFDCRHRGIGVHDCKHSEDAGVRCYP